jgi:protein phosphatase 2C family protein 2/3
MNSASANFEGSVVDSSTTKCSVRGHGRVAGYAVNTHQGIVRSYNEDRVSIVLNIMKPPNRP